MVERHEARMKNVLVFISLSAAHKLSRQSGGGKQKMQKCETCPVSKSRACDIVAQGTMPVEIRAVNNVVGNFYFDSLHCGFNRPFSKS
jgi:hypothetical protein